MVATLLVSLAAFTALWAWLLMLRFTQLRTRSRMRALGDQDRVRDRGRIR